MGESRTNWTVGRARQFGQFRDDPARASEAGKKGAQQTWRNTGHNGWDASGR
jgi:general stress protein YciG